MRTYLILLYITLFAAFNLYASEENTKIKKQPAIVNNTYHNSLNEQGISFIKLGSSIYDIETKLSAISKLPPINATEYNYYTILNKIKNTNFQNKNIIIKNGRIYYKKLIELKLVEKIKDNADNATFSTKELKYPTQKIWKELTSLNLKFYEKQLYESTFYLTVNPQTMNKIVEDMHKTLGEKSRYSNLLETYTWQKYNEKLNYTITLSLPGKLFPRKIKINFIDKSKEELLQKDFKEEKKTIDKLLLP